MAMANRNVQLSEHHKQVYHAAGSWGVVSVHLHESIIVAAYAVADAVREVTAAVTRVRAVRHDKSKR